ncbi:MAG: hypothetical protein EGQ09_16895 [Clostridiales bacterium]|nr:hypothetical protein [Clostridiales bacterium]
MGQTGGGAYSAAGDPGCGDPGAGPGGRGRPGKYDPGGAAGGRSRGMGDAAFRRRVQRLCRHR